jgi:hypothetical protein
VIRRFIFLSDQERFAAQILYYAFPHADGCGVSFHGE